MYNNFVKFLFYLSAFFWTERTQLRHLKQNVLLIQCSAQCNINSALHLSESPDVNIEVTLKVYEVGYLRCSFVFRQSPPVFTQYFEHVNMKELLVRKIRTRQECGRCFISAFMPFHGMDVVFCLSTPPQPPIPPIHTQHTQMGYWLQKKTCCR